MTSGASAACAASYNNKVYVFGGFNAGGITDNNRIYDVANNTWSFGASLSTPTAGAA